MLLGVVASAVQFSKRPWAEMVSGASNRAPAFEMMPIPEDLIRFNHDLVGAVDPLYARRTIPEWRIDAGLPRDGAVRTRASHMRK